MPKVDHSDNDSTGFDPVATLFETARRYGISKIANAMGKSEQLIYGKLRENVDNKTATLREAYAITLQTRNPALLEGWAHELGGVFMPLPALEGGDDNLVEELLELLESVGEFATRLKANRADGVITPDEYRTQQRAAAAIYQKLGRLMLDLKSQVRELPKGRNVSTLR